MFDIDFLYDPLLIAYVSIVCFEFRADISDLFSINE